MLSSTFIVLLAACSLVNGLPTIISRSRQIPVTRPPRQPLPAVPDVIGFDGPKGDLGNSTSPGNSTFGGSGVIPDPGNSTSTIPGIPGGPNGEGSSDLENLTATILSARDDKISDLGDLKLIPVIKPPPPPTPVGEATGPDDSKPSVIKPPPPTPTVKVPSSGVSTPSPVVKPPTPIPSGDANGEVPGPEGLEPSGVIKPPTPDPVTQPPSEAVTDGTEGGPKGEGSSNPETLTTIVLSARDGPEGEVPGSEGPKPTGVPRPPTPVDDSNGENPSPEGSKPTGVPRPPTPSDDSNGENPSPEGPKPTGVPRPPTPSDDSNGENPSPEGPKPTGVPRPPLEAGEIIAKARRGLPVDNVADAEATTEVVGSLPVITRTVTATGVFGASVVTRTITATGVAGTPSSPVVTETVTVTEVVGSATATNTDAGADATTVVSSPDVYAGELWLILG